MKIHHLNCGTMCPLAASYLNKHHHFVCHCFLIETEEGLVLVDTGLGLLDVADPKKRLGRLFNTVVRGTLREEETAIRQIEALGFSADDVRHIIPTHLDLDHVGGLSDFPKATVHVYADEYNAAMQRKGKNKMRYHPVQWNHQPKWEIYGLDGDTWQGFDCVRSLRGVPNDVLLVPITGHSEGHCGIAVSSGSGWLFHAGDAYFHHDEVYTQHGQAPLVLRWFQGVIQANGRLRKHNQARLRDLQHRSGHEITIVCAHDPTEFQMCRKTG